MYLADGLSASTLTDMSWAEWHEIFYIFSVIYNDLRHETLVSTDEKKVQKQIAKEKTPSNSIEERRHHFEQMALRALTLE